MKLGNMSVPGDCGSISPILARIGDKWSTLIILVLSEGPKRYSVLRREIESISQRMLTLTLRALERDGLILRTVHADKNPPQVEYELTDLGKTLIDPLYALCLWASQNCDAIEENRKKHEAEQADA
ncbi:transcriptional regulator, HxlR family [Cohaesibacter marisflavi]|uniref:Transcriptional regulator, HxlR family n=1 Tax=Cohaesibacter marisflavi TaxID=655353 RepID=A0A1I5H903_9HYPH|nr:helix-turn-helix domain-containing protein [Cohaesibacter marisflavi]SFO44659.1 transcriptional regulator, HxlR family [Cohaesibacter marisflavi]